MSKNNKPADGLRPKFCPFKKITVETYDSDAGQTIKTTRFGFCSREKCMAYYKGWDMSNGEHEGCKINAL